MSARRYRMTIKTPESGATVTDAIEVLRRLGVEVLTVETDRRPTREERRAIREAIEDGLAWDTRLTRYLETHWGMTGGQVAAVLLRCIEDPATRGEFVRLAEEWV